MSRVAVPSYSDLAPLDRLAAIQVGYNNLYGRSARAAEGAGELAHRDPLRRRLEDADSATLGGRQGRPVSKARGMDHAEEELMKQLRQRIPEGTE